MGVRLAQMLVATELVRLLRVLSASSVVGLAPPLVVKPRPAPSGPGRRKLGAAESGLIPPRNHIRPRTI